MRSVFLGVALSLFLVGQSFASIQIDFENDLTSYSGATFQSGITRLSETTQFQAYSGGFYMLCASSPLSVTLTTAADYIVSFYWANANTSQSATVNVYNSSNVLAKSWAFTSPPPPSDGDVDVSDYAQLSSFVQDVKRIEFTSTVLPNFLFDDLFLTDPPPPGGEVPEPATLAMWSVLSLVGVGAWRRRSRRR